MSYLWLFYSQYFTKVLRSGDFPDILTPPLRGQHGAVRQDWAESPCSRFLGERLKSLLRFRDLLILIPPLHISHFAG